MKTGLVDYLKMSWPSDKSRFSFEAREGSIRESNHPLIH